MVSFTIFAGGYTSYILSYLFNPDATSLTLLANTTTGDSPSWLAFHPSDKSILYATNEVTVGAVQSFKITSSGRPNLVDTESSGGNGPAFATPLKSGELAAMNYGSGTGRFIPTSSGGTVFSGNAPVITFAPPPGGASNPHEAVEYGNEVFVPDLGGNKVWRLGKTGSTWSIHGFIPHPAGSGPRHMVAYDDTLFVLHETSNQLTTQPVPSFPNGTSAFTSSTSIVPTDAPANGVFAAAELLLKLPAANARHALATVHLYASNRNIAPRDPSIPKDPRGDSIAIFEYTPKTPATKTGTIKLVKQVYTGLQEIRGMSFGDGPEAGEYLVAAGGVSGGLVVYKVCDSGADLKEVASDRTVEGRSAAVMV